MFYRVLPQREIVIRGGYTFQEISHCIHKNIEFTIISAKLYSFSLCAVEILSSKYNNVVL